MDSKVVVRVTGLTGKTNYRMVILLSREICTCDHCGSEAEMVITCSLESSDDNAEQSAPADQLIPEAAAGNTKGRGVCSHCGNESEIWVEI